MNKWGNLQFFHHELGFRGKRYSVAIGVPAHSYMMQVVTDMMNGVKPADLICDVGISIVHPKDPFSRKIGRELTSKRLLPFSFRCINLNFVKPGTARMTLESEGLYIEFQLRTDLVCTPYLQEVYGSRVYEGCNE